MNTLKKMQFEFVVLTLTLVAVSKAQIKYSVRGSVDTTTKIFESDGSIDVPGWADLQYSVDFPSGSNVTIAAFPDFLRGQIYVESKAQCESAHTQASGHVTLGDKGEGCSSMSGMTSCWGKLSVYSSGMHFLALINCGVSGLQNTNYDFMSDQQPMSMSSSTSSTQSGLYLSLLLLSLTLIHQS